MNRYERLNTLLEMVAEQGHIEVDGIATELDVSSATIRRDLDHLGQQQLLTRTRGGAVATSVAYDLPLRYKAARRAPEKQRIGRAAAALAAPGMVVGINGGTTATEVARELATRVDLMAGRDARPLTVVTNALNIANELTVRPHLKIVVTGGVVRAQSYELVGPLATRILDEITLDIAFLGVDAVDPELGASAHHEGEASINRLLASRAEKVVVVADASKLGRRAFARICAVNELDMLVTDSAADAGLVRRFKDAGLDVLEV